MSRYELNGKRLLVVGLAATGEAVAQVAVRRGALVTVTDRADETALAERIARLPAGVETVFGGHEGIDPDAYDLAVISPGVPWDAPLAATLRKAGVETVSEIELASRLLDAPIIAVTGANGKSTTTTLVGEALAADGRKTFVGGNLGDPLIGAVDGDYDWIVAEVSSFQLEGVTTFKPKIGVLLNITPDHLDRHASLENYAGIKARVAARMGEGDTLIVNADDPLTATVAAPAPARTLVFSPAYHGRYGAWVEGGSAVAQSLLRRETMFELADLKIPGLHNLENGLAAGLAALCAGVSTDHLRRAVRAFAGLPHRMEQVGVIDGVTFVNDSKGTNVDATIKSLAGYEKNVALIAGGSSKGGDFAPLAEAIRRRVKGVVLIGETAAAIETALGKYQPKIRAATMEEAVAVAAAWCGVGETVLLSPACASFDMFDNYRHRGESFKRAVERLREARHAG
jgi:UDP-N-acetylmuramoylalanine--D-glutamate ligase